MTLRLEVAPADRPVDLDAIAVEDDTYSVLSADPGFKEPTEHPIRIWTEVHETEPAEPGSVSVQPGKPLRLLAVVHDLSADPTWKEEWIVSALDEIFRRAEELGIQALGLPILGAVHGRLPLARFVQILRNALRRKKPATLERLWLIPPAGAEDELERLTSIS